MAVSLGGANSGVKYRRALCGVGGSTIVFPFPLQYKSEKETLGVVAIHKQHTGPVIDCWEE